GVARSLEVVVTFGRAMRRVLAFFCATSIAVGAHAQTPTPDPTAEHAVVVKLTGFLAWIYKSDTPGGLAPREPWDPGFYVQLAIDARVSRRASFGGLYSNWSGLSGLSLQRLSGEARYHAVRTPGFDMWGGGEVGLAWWTFHD